MERLEALGAGGAEISGGGARVRPSASVALFCLPQGPRYAEEILRFFPFRQRAPVKEI
jgi:hypothetical protein